MVYSVFFCLLPLRKGIQRLLADLFDTGLAGIPSDQQTVILNASPQNSPGEVKSPTAAGKVFWLFKD